MRSHSGWPTAPSLEVTVESASLFAPGDLQVFKLNQKENRRWNYLNGRGLWISQVVTSLVSHALKSGASEFAGSVFLLQPALLWRAVEM